MSEGNEPVVEVKAIEHDIDFEMVNGSLMLSALVSKGDMAGLEMKLHISLVPLLEKLAAKTETEWDDKLIPIVAKILENISKK